MLKVQKSVERRTKETDDPFRLGWRYVTHIGPGGEETIGQVPLTERDVLHPQEEDFIVQNHAHTLNCIYIKESAETVHARRSDVLVLFDHRIDWQEPGIEPHGPDVTVLEGLRQPWDPHVGTFRVHDMEAKVLLAVEVTSQTTWGNDVGIKVDEYFRAKVPYYVIVDSRAIDTEVVVIGYKANGEGYLRLPIDPEKGVWIPSVGMWFKAEDDRVRCLDRDGVPIPDRAELEERARQREAELSARLEEETKRANREMKRANQATKRADQEAKRAKAAEAEIRKLTAQLKTKAKRRTK